MGVGWLNRAMCERSRLLKRGNQGNFDMSGAGCSQPQCARVVGPDGCGENPTRSVAACLAL